MTIKLPPIHPDDLLFFHEVSAAMKRVARHYELPLKSVTVLPMPAAGMADRMGDCNSSGAIRVVFRCTENGTWCEHPLSPGEVWDTAAHELAHLTHPNHGLAFQELRLELLQALRNATQPDHRDRVLAKLVKMQDVCKGEAELGNTAAAEAFAEAINRMLVEHELQPTDIDYARATDKDPVIEVKVNLGLYGVKFIHRRSAWQEHLARIVAHAHLCTFLLQEGTNNIWFAGTRSHAIVAEYVYGTLVPAADRMAVQEFNRYGAECLKRDGHMRARRGFRESWLVAFVCRIEARLKEARKVAVQEAAEPGTALMRLEGAMVKVKTYIDDKFKKKHRAGALSAMNLSHREAMARGEAAADRMVLGRRGVTGVATKALPSGTV